LNPRPPEPHNARLAWSRRVNEILDAGSEDLPTADFEVFELKHLLALDDRIVVPVLLYLFRHVERRLGNRPTLIEIDEAWLALMHSLFGQRINHWLLTLRKQNAAVILATQSPAQLTQSPFRHTVFDSCPTRIYLPNAEASTPGQLELYRDLGLNDREIASIARAVPKRHYYFKSPRGSRLFELGLGPLALAFLAGLPGTTVDETRRQVEALAEREQRWPGAWLESLGLADWADRYRSLADMDSMGGSTSARVDGRSPSGTLPFEGDLYDAIRNRSAADARA
jgi:type IV secretory pathway VirB4 component